MLYLFSLTAALWYALEPPKDAAGCIFKTARSSAKGSRKKAVPIFSVNGQINKAFSSMLSENHSSYLIKQGLSLLIICLWVFLQSSENACWQMFCLHPVHTDQLLYPQRQGPPYSSQEGYLDVSPLKK